MAAKENSRAEPEAARRIVIERMLHAPRELVWKAWTDPGQIVHWWGPTGFTTTIETMDVRPGGVWKYVMHGPDGTDYPNKSVFIEVTVPERIVFAHGGGRVGQAADQFEGTWTFEALGEKTRVTIDMLFSTPADRDRIVKEYGAIEGGHQTLQRLAERVGTMSGQGTLDRDFVIARVFNAPRERVFQAFTDPEHMGQWWGPKGFTVVSARMDLRPGGSYHYAMRGPDGGTMWGKFIYREIVAPERLVFVNAFSDAAGNLTRHPMSPTWPLELLSTLTFEPHGDGTLLTIRSAPLASATAEERRTFNEAHAGMDQGWTGTLDQLTTYLAHT
jgi:uncharacterized protein YndB with AHSA1/START domain